MRLIEQLFGKGSALSGPDVPPDIAEAVRDVQLQRALAHVPMIYAVAIFNVLLVMILCANRGLPLSSYGWMGIVAIGALARMIYWIRQRARTTIADHPERLIATLTIVSTTLISGLSGWTIYAYSSGLIADMMLIPISLVFGSTIIAHCLAPIRRAAVGVLFVGVMPCGLFMIFNGDFETRLLGASMLTVMLLMMVFILESYDRIIGGIVMEEEIRRLAHRDSLTGLHNRRAIMDAIDAADQKAKDGDGGYALAVLDLDGFKRVNDTLGHHAGDMLLKIVAERLDGAVATGDFIGRTGGDEFVMLMCDVQATDAADERAQVVMSALCRPANVEGSRIPISGSIGYAIRGRHGATPEQLLVAADQALYAAKRDHYAGRGDRRADSLRSAA